MSSETVGRVKTIWISPEGLAVISEIFVVCTSIEESPKLSFRGPVHFSKKVQKNLNDTALIHVNDISEGLKLKKHSFVLSGVNLGATASESLTIELSEFSLGLSVPLACLSSALSMPIPQDTLFTGHIGSSAGDILMVGGFTEKCEAAKRDQKISRFVHPKFESDLSYQQLKPIEYENSVAAIRGCRGHLQLVEVANTLDVFTNVIDPKAILTAALKNDFFELHVLEDKNELSKLIHFITRNNNRWFFQILENNLLEKDIQSAHDLISLYVKYYNRKKSYPSRFGQKLHKLLLSVPSYLFTLDGFFPLLPMDHYINLVQHASKRDHNDVLLLLKAIQGDIKTANQKPYPKSKTATSMDNMDQILDFLLEQLDPNRIQSTITGPYDEAKGNYSRDRNIVANNDEFREAIVEFYTFLYRHTNKVDGNVDPIQMSIQAINLLPKVYRSKNGYNEALRDAIHGTNGGLQSIFTKLTDYLKEEARQQYIFKTFQDTIDPLDYRTKVNLIKQIIEKTRDNLPEEIVTAAPEKFVDDYEEIILALIKSQEMLTDILRRY